MKKILLVLLGLVVAVVGAAFAVGPALIDARINRVQRRADYQPSERARALYPRLTIVDLHADPLMWKRDLLVRSDRGHVDVPRLIEGNVAVQAFTVVTKVPLFLNIDRNDDRTDMFSFLAVADRWPRAAWGSLRERALYQAEKLRRLAGDSQGRLTLLRTRGELDGYLERRAREPHITAGFLGLEGAHALEGNLDNIDVLYDAGFRMMAHVHFFDNDLAGSAHGVNKGGLTDQGREMVRRMEARHMLVDIAHASPRAVDDVLGMATRPVVVSHTGVKGTCDNNRTISDEHIRGVARTGGVVGIGYWDSAVCDPTAAGIARAIRYAVDVGGVEHVGLGSDFDGATTTPFDTGGLIELVDALFAEGFSDEQVALIMGGNALRVLRETLP